MRNSSLSKYLTATFFSTNTLLRLAAVLLLTAGFAYLNRAYLVTDMYEVGDFAANSLLIQHAKHFELLVGNYSRVGFNHPGPAILYVLACGEWLFYDCLGWVKAPFAGQMIAEGAYSAFWIVMLATLLARIYRSIAVAGMALVLALTATVYFDSNIVTGLWFPHLYFFPFATFLLALVPLIAGRGDTLVILALSCGFLIHGHVSFVAICGVMVAGALAINQRSAARRSAVTRIVSMTFLKNFQAQFWLIGLLFIVFFSPLVLETLRNFPGPIAQYMSFSAGNHHHSFINGVQFASDFWKTGITPIIVAVLAALLFARANSAHTNSAQASIAVERQAPTIEYAGAASAAFLLATAALILYAMYGVDSLSFNYVGIFYYAVPAFALALMLASFLTPYSRGIQVAVAVVVIAAALPYTIRQLAKPTGYASNYHDARIAHYFDQIKSLRGNNLIVLEIDNSQDWGPIWSALLGVEIYSARHQPEQLFCIHKNWHISFAREWQCTEQQVKEGDRYIVSTSTALVKAPQHSAIDLDNIHFYKFQPTVIASGSWLKIVDNNAAYASGILDSGWSLPNGEFVWSEGKQALLSFTVDAQTPPSSIEFELSAFLPHADSQQNVETIINGIRVGTIRFDKQNDRAARAFALPPGVLAKDGVVKVQFNIEKPMSPSAAGQSDDNRQLGIALYGIQIKN